MLSLDKEVDEDDSFIVFISSRCMFSALSIFATCACTAFSVNVSIAFRKISLRPIESSNRSLMCTNERSIASSSSFVVN